ncbi:hypothetical protein ACQ856_18155 [Mycolicibacterium psychrotolerans]|uniref:hypothetical protein n=1 Tax=Mycolicibacterium psychrotolerans TaxID=216929 RepID=UPI003D67B65D
MSNKSRARFRHEHDTDDAEQAPADPAEVEAMGEVFDEFAKGNQRAGVSKWAGLVLRDREKALATPVDPSSPLTSDQVLKTADRPAAVNRPEYRDPTPYEVAVLAALGNRMVTIDRGGNPPMVVPVSVASGGMYGGTVEPERVAKRRRRNKAARAARSGARRRVRGRVYKSPFGYPVVVPGISRRNGELILDADGNQLAEVVDA